MNLRSNGFLPKKIHIKNNLSQILINMQRKEETGANWRKRPGFFCLFCFFLSFFLSFFLFFFPIFGGLLWPGLKPSIYSFQGKKVFFSDHSWKETLTELSCSPSPMSSVFSGRGIWGGFPAKWLQLFPQHQSDGVSAHVDFGFSLPLEPSSVRAFALRPGALDKHSSFWVLNISIWWILLLISPGEKSKILESPLCPVTTMVFPPHRTFPIFYVAENLENSMYKLCQSIKIRILLNMFQHILTVFWNSRLLWRL